MTISVFGSSNCNEKSFEYTNAYMIGELLAQNDFNIATGGYNGVMEAALKGARTNEKVERIGVITKEIRDRKVNQYVSNSILMDTYLQRLEKLIKIADAYVFLPGGTGTLLELSAVWSLTQREIIPVKPTICIGDSWENIIETVAFYSENALSNMKILSFAKNADEAAKLIIENINK